jgi:outer membrane lipoprotein carrier protein
VAAVALLSLSTVANAKPIELPLLLQEVERTYALAGTVFANFDQVNESAALKTKKPSSGHIVIKRPNKIRWETLTPNASLLVSDGIKAWFYTPPFDSSEAGQYSEYPASMIHSQLANALLSGNFSASPDTKVRAVSDHEFVLTPKTGTAGDVKEARIEVDLTNKFINRVQLFHKDGNHADIHLSEIKLGQKFGDDMFVFKAPPNTEKIQE